MIILFIQSIVYEALLSTKLPLYLKEHLKNAASQNPVDENKAILFIFPSYMQIQVGKERDKNAFVSIIQEDAWAHSMSFIQIFILELILITRTPELYFSQMHLASLSQAPP